MRLRIAARSSVLARLQAREVGAALTARFPELEVEFAFRESLGDRNQHDPLWQLPEKGVFTEDFRADLLEGRADLVVHSWKDLPTEERDGTEIAATLPRADQRDLLLFKHEALHRSEVAILSSSPRRAYHLGNFLPDHLPWRPNRLDFRAVRGNIPTRVRKWREDPAAHGLVVAKAALDRLLAWDHPEGRESRADLRSALAGQLWMVLPLAASPNAPAQGALAIEVRTGRTDLAPYLAAINCPATFRAAELERRVLRRYGGGCHQKIGVGVRVREFGELTYLSGLTDDGVTLRELTVERTGPSLSGRRRNESAVFRVTREALDQAPPAGADAFWMARGDFALPPAGAVVWAAGLDTWKKLAARGQWVHGSAEGLGEGEAPGVELLAGRALRWARGTHLDAPGGGGKLAWPLYRARYELDRIDPLGGNFYFWQSGAAARCAFAAHPELREAFHACGPGRTRAALTELLGGGERISVFFNEQHWKDSDVS